jgi:hypothetical protein
MTGWKRASRGHHGPARDSGELQTLIRGCSCAIKSGSDKSTRSRSRLGVVEVQAGQRCRWLVRTGVLARHSEVQAPASQRPASYTSTSACVLQTLPARSCGDTTCLLGNSTTRTGPSRTTSPRKTRPFSTDGDPFNWLPPRDRPHEDHGHNQRILKLWRHWSSIWSCSHYRRRGCSLKCYSSYNFVRCLLSSPHL